MNNLRIPTQKRSIDKKERIIKHGFELICKNGYYNTNTAQIAKKAGVSTGIVYSYFNNKHDILIAGLEKYSSKIFYPMIDISNLSFNKNNFKQYISSTIETYISSTKNSNIHYDEILSIVHSDKEIAKFYYMKQMSLACRFSNYLIRNGFNREHLLEKVHLSLNIIDNFCHEVINHKHQNMDYTIMIEMISNDVYNIIVK